MDHRANIILVICYLALILTFGILVGAKIALGVSPECINPTNIHDPAVEYDATTSIRFCTPQLDDGGFPLPANDLVSCTITANGLSFIETVTEPGQYVIFNVPEEVKQVARTGSFDISCKNIVGDGEKETAPVARFLAPAAPGRPVLLGP
jgi:hypothetical protein